MDCSFLACHYAARPSARPGRSWSPDPTADSAHTSKRRNCSGSPLPRACAPPSPLSGRVPATAFDPFCPFWRRPEARQANGIAFTPSPQRYGHSRTVLQGASMTGAAGDERFSPASEVPRPAQSAGWQRPRTPPSTHSRAAPAFRLSRSHLTIRSSRRWGGGGAALCVYLLQRPVVERGPVHQEVRVQGMLRHAYSAPQTW